MNGNEEECKFERMTHPLAAVSGRGLLRGAGIYKKKLNHMSVTLFKSKLFNILALHQKYWADGP